MCHLDVSCAHTYIHINSSVYSMRNGTTQCYRSFFYSRISERDLGQKTTPLIRLCRHIYLSITVRHWVQMNSNQENTNSKIHVLLVVPQKKSAELHFKSEFCGIKSRQNKRFVTIAMRLRSFFNITVGKKELRNITIYRVCVSALMRERIQSPLFIWRQRKKDERSKEYERRKNTKRTKKNQNVAIVAVSTEGSILFFL